MENMNTKNLIYDISTGYIKSYSLKVILELEIPSKLKTGPKTIKQLCEECKGYSEHGLYVLLRTFSTMGIFKEDEEIDRLFSNTEISETLINDSNKYPWVNDSYLQVTLLPYFNQIEESLKCGKSMATFNNGYNDGFDFIHKENNVKKYFHNTMTEYTRNQINSILEIVDFDKFKTIVDLGGCQGELIKKILDKYPLNSSMIEKGVNYDLKQAIEKNEKNYKDNRYFEKMGNFFTDETVPIGDCYLVKYIFHMFSDNQVLQILEKIFKSIKFSNQNEVCIYIFDHIIYKNKTSIPISIEFHTINILNGGKERTFNEWNNLIKSSNFKIDKISNLPNTLCSFIKLSLK
ncbi:hypothetical protein ACTFIZ_009390 [Dictyostelium cf. discoideum]